MTIQLAMRLKWSFNMFKSFLQVVASWFLIFGFAFLIGSFTETTFQINLWSKETKDAVSVVTIIYSIISFVLWIFFRGLSYL